MKELGFKYAETKGTGRKPYNPRDMLKLYLYGYLNRIRSSRRLEKETHRNLELMWLLRKLTPDFKTIADFRKDNKSAIKKVCKEFIFLCKNLDLFGTELVAIDGSKFKAVNSKKRNLLTEHIFGTIKRNFNQGYMLLKGKEKVSAEMALTVLAYNIKRVLNIVGLERLKKAVYRGRVFKNKIINGGKKKFFIVLRFLARMNLLHPNFSHSLTLGEIARSPLWKNVNMLCLYTVKQ